MTKNLFSFFSLFFFIINFTSAQCLITGADLSYVNTIEASGGVYQNGNGEVVDPFEYFAERGAGMVRMRLWHTPENLTSACGQPISTNNLSDVIMAFKRAKNAGMQLNLAIHYGDYFNDPSKQKMPAAWQGLSHEILLDSIYRYTFTVLNKLNTENILPDVVAIGNETTGGFVDATANTDGWEWPQDAEKFNIGFKAVDDFNSANNSSVKKAVHFTDKTAAWLSGLFNENNITNYDIIGLSFYPKWTEFNSIDEFGNLISDLKSTYQKEIMVFETGVPWTTDFADNYNNFMSDFGPLNYPVSPQGQKDFLMALAQSVYENGATALIYWEPAWISSNMCDLWGQGSSYENVSFFDFNNANQPLPAFDFFDFCSSVNNNNNLPKSFSINIFPNPNDNKELRINSSEKIVSWELIYLNGQVIENGIFENNNTNYKITFEQDFIGIHYLKLKTSSGETFSKKINFK
ncbi:MAG: glycosyl hydrolase 53 family protein [Bacteroidota bacterium]